MTYAEAIQLKAAIETALLTASSTGAVYVSHGDRAITYQSKSDASGALAELNRNIHRYSKKSLNQNPDWRSPIWR